MGGVMVMVSGVEPQEAQVECSALLGSSFSWSAIGSAGMSRAAWRAACVLDPEPLRRCPKQAHA